MGAFVQDRKAGSSNHQRSHRTEAQNQERLLQRLSKGQSADDSDNSVDESPANRNFVRRTRAYENQAINSPRRYEG